LYRQDAPEEKARNPPNEFGREDRELHDQRNRKEPAGQLHHRDIHVSSVRSLSKVDAVDDYSSDGVDEA
jgi:hypothetical protein